MRRQFEICEWKICSKCLQVKPLADFSLEWYNRDGHIATCKECCSWATKKRLVYTFYKLTWEEYESRLAQQGGVCAICRIPNNEKRRLAIDHDHSCCPGEKSCGKCVRGILCSNCNCGIGSFGEDIQRLRAVSDYLTNTSLHAPVERSKTITRDAIRQNAEWTTIRCIACDVVKPLSEFYRHKQMRTGHISTCQDCFLEAGRWREVLKDTGCSKELFEQLMVKQDGKCAICLGPPRGKTYLSVDHDHQTKYIRGLLCMPCNSRLGFLKDNLDIVESTIKYLQSYYRREGSDASFSNDNPYRGK